MAIRLLPQEDPEFQIAPMIDILLVLLVFFMAIASEQVLQNDPGLVLPAATQAATIDESKEIALNIRWNSGQTAAFEVAGKGLMDATALTALIKDRKNDGGKFRVVIRADKRVNCHAVRSAMEAIAAAGERQIVFSVVSETPK